MNLLHGGGHWVIALDKATGEEIWKIARKTDARGESKEAYASPCLWQNGKDAYIVVLGADYATAHRLSDGSEIWRLADLNPPAKYSTAFRIITSPVAAPDLIVVPTCRGNGPVFGVSPSAQGLIRPGSPGLLWQATKCSPDVPSPVIMGGLVYLCRDGNLECLDAKSGQLLYVESLHNARYRGSPVYADGKIYCTSRDGWFSVVKAGRNFELLAVNQLPDEFAASPVFANGRIYLRGFKTLYAIQEGTK
jgi:outer membrane protein assembly factor BamB